MGVIPSLVPDCERCAALCCVAFAFDAGAEFAHEKESNEPCHNLCDNHLCKIHADLPARGYTGCVSFGCFGAGQHVVQGLFDGQDWRQDPAIFAPMMEAFRNMRMIHDLARMLETAAALNLPPAPEQQRQDYLQALFPDQGWDRQSLTCIAVDDIGQQIDRFLRSLRGLAPPPAKQL
jgi:hypothetical protein